jgi:hypothetical protein
MDSVTEALGVAIHAFEADTCSAFNTKELKCEVEGCQHRVARIQSRHEGMGSTAIASTRKPKTLNLRTYKLHALGDYTASIRMYGTTDSYSTQPVSFPSVFIAYALTLASGRTGAQSWQRKIYTH